MQVEQTEQYRIVFQGKPMTGLVSTTLDQAQAYIDQAVKSGGYVVRSDYVIEVRTVVVVASDWHAPAN